MSELTHPPDDGCYIHGLFLEGARWDPAAFQLAESRPKELYTEMAVIWLLPVPNRKPPASGIYLCPIYKTLTRAGKCPSPISRRREGCSSWDGSPGEAAAKCCTHGHRARHCWTRPSRDGRKDFSCRGHGDGAGRHPRAAAAPLARLSSRPPKPLKPLFSHSCLACHLAQG